MPTSNKGFFIGLSVFALVLLIGLFGLIPQSLEALDGKEFFIKDKSFAVDSYSAWIVLAILLLMAIWWATEAIPVPVTALIPLALFPILDITSFQQAAAPFADKNIYFYGK